LLLPLPHILTQLALALLVAQGVLTVVLVVPAVLV
jgi:hypothetical protein